MPRLSPEQLNHDPYQESLRAVYFPITKAASSKLDLVRIGPQYEFISNNESKLIVSSIFLMPDTIYTQKAHAQLYAHDADKLFLVAESNQSIVGHQITTFDINPGIIRAEDMMRETNTLGFETALFMERAHMDVLDRLAVIHGKQVDFHPDWKKYQSVADRLGLGGYKNNTFLPTDDHNKYKKLYTNTLDDLIRIKIEAIIKDTEDESTTKFRIRSESKAGNSENTRMDKLRDLIDNLLPMMQKQIGM